MAKNRANPIPTFSPNQTLKSIRENSLNPVIERVLQVEGNIEANIAPTQRTVYKNVIFDKDKSTLTFEKVGKDDPTAPQASTVIDLSSIVPVYAGIEIKGYTTHGDAGFPGGGDERSISKIKFEDANISKDVDGFGKVVYVWDKIVPAFQKDQTVSITGATTGPGKGPYTALEVVGLGAPEYFTYTSAGLKAGTVRIDMPIIPEQMTAQVVGGSSTDIKPINKIEVRGTVGGSIIDGTTLQIDLPSGAGKFNVGYFQGFFNSINQIPDSKDLVVDRSSAYVMMEVSPGLSVYVLHMYKGPSVTDKWYPTPTKPGLIYEGSGAGDPAQGVSTIKNNPLITVTPTGQLDLDELGKHGGSVGNEYFLGIYDTVDEIRNIPNPTADKSYALLRNASAKNGYLPYSYRKDNAGGADAPEWRLTPALGHLVYVATDNPPSELPAVYTPIYGIKAEGSTVDDKGVITIPSGGASSNTINVMVTNAAGTDPQRGDVRTFRFNRMVGDVEYTTGSNRIELHPAQRNILKVDDAWIATHNTKDYLGKLYYDVSTGKWMGMNDKDVTDPNDSWTSVIHSGMSDQVVSLDTRYPKQNTPITSATPTTDVWGVSGMSYLPEKNESLPSEIKDTAGGFINTDIKKNTAAAGSDSNETRIQTCHADDDSGRVFMRSYQTATNSWNPWVRTSFSTNDMKAHQEDPAAHRTVIKYYRLLAVHGKYQDIHAQTEAQSAGAILATNVYTIADNYGYSGDLKNYLDAPYSGTFSIGGVCSFSGYKDTDKKFQIGVWQLILRKRTSSTAGEYSPVAQFRYEHTNENKPYPSLRFRVEDVSLLEHQELIANLTFNNNEALKVTHPDLYMVPTRSYVYIEDKECRAGSYIGNAHRVLYGNVDVIGDVGVKSHHTDFKPDKTIRVFGEVVNKTPVEMTKINS
ncbi:MAG: hypothetical protein ACRC6V_00745 [Bacteroidales bacterium]